MYVCIATFVYVCRNFYIGPLGVYTVEDVVDSLGFGLFQFGVMFAGTTYIGMTCNCSTVR